MVEMNQPTPTSTSNSFKCYTRIRKAPLDNEADRVTVIGEKYQPFSSFSMIPTFPSDLALDESLSGGKLITKSSATEAQERILSRLKKNKDVYKLAQKCKKVTEMTEKDLLADIGEDEDGMDIEEPQDDEEGGEDANIDIEVEINEDDASDNASNAPNLETDDTFENDPENEDATALEGSVDDYTRHSVTEHLDETASVFDPDQHEDISPLFDNLHSICPDDTNASYERMRPYTLSQRVNYYYKRIIGIQFGNLEELSPLAS